jgi:hypothetical protein
MDVSLDDLLSEVEGAMASPRKSVGASPRGSSGWVMIRETFHGLCGFVR